MSHDPVENLPIRNAEKCFETFESGGIQVLQMRIGKGCEDQIQFPETAPLRPEKRLLPAGFE